MVLDLLHVCEKLACFCSKFIASMLDDILETTTATILFLAMLVNFSVHNTVRLGCGGKTLQ